MEIDTADKDHLILHAMGNNVDHRNKDWEKRERSKMGSVIG